MWAQCCVGNAILSNLQEWHTVQEYITKHRPVPHVTWQDNGIRKKYSLAVIEYVSYIYINFSRFYIHFISPTFQSFQLRWSPQCLRSTTLWFWFQSQFTWSKSAVDTSSTSGEYIVTLERLFSLFILFSLVSVWMCLHGASDCEPVCSPAMCRWPVSLAPPLAASGGVGVTKCNCF